MKAFDDVKAYLEAARKDLEENGDPAIIADLKALGKRIIEAAQESKQTGNITGNQLDAFGYGVYYNKRLISTGYLANKYRMDHNSKRTGKIAIGAEQDKRRKVWGRAEAFNATKNFVPDRDGYVLFIVNAMYYSSVHENKYGRQIVRQEIPAAFEELRSRYKHVDLEFFNFGW